MLYISGILGRRSSTLEMCMFIFRGRRNALDVSSCVFLQIAFLTLRQMVRSEKKVQILCDSSETFRKMMEALQEMSILR